MWILVRTALIWLLAVALPVQGAAAATMLACGPGHHGAAGSHAHSAAAGQAPHSHDHGTQAAPAYPVQHDHHAGHNAAQAHTHGDGADHHHGGTPGESLEASPTDASPTASATGNPVHKSAGKCSACASCCTVAVLPTSAFAIASPVHADRVAVFFPVQAAVFMTGGLDRPPRTFLA